MVLNINGIDRKTIIIGKSVYSYSGEWRNALVCNSTFRGQNLGAFNETFAEDIKEETFNNMWIGDTFTQNGNTYKIGGFNYLIDADHNKDLPPHLLMITNILKESEMNSSDTTNGGFAGSEVWQSYFLPTLVSQLKADFGDHLLTWNEYLTTGTDGNAANQGEFFPVQASMMNTVMYWGTPSQYSTPVNGVNFNTGIETKQLPIMQLHPEERNGNNYDWQRDIYNSSSFAYAEKNGTPGSIIASSNGLNVRAFFLIG